MSETRKILMKDGRTVEFGEKQKIDKDYDTTSVPGTVSCQIDFDNGETVIVKVKTTDAVALAAIGHGLSQKLGDAAAGAESTSDAYEAILEVAARISKGEWNKSRGTGEGGTAKGASELLEALVIVLKIGKEQARAALAELKQGDKLALRKTPEIAAAIEKIKAAKAPSKTEAEKAAAGTNLLTSLKTAVAGGAPVGTPAAAKSVEEAKAAGAAKPAGIKAK